MTCRGGGAHMLQCCRCQTVDRLRMLLVWWYFSHFLHIYLIMEVPAISQMKCGFRNSFVIYSYLIVTSFVDQFGWVKCANDFMKLAKHDRWYELWLSKFCLWTRNSDKIGSVLELPNNFILFKSAKLIRQNAHKSNA